jgi:DNA-binding winged helix-turn-helix (wHTH) protein/tetratricopeptide (TPR) repeat protein
MTADGASIDGPLSVGLTREPDFRLGTLQVRPSICQVVFDGRLIDLQPKIMQVLVVLARAQGRAISRDDLLAICWGGVFVGDDAVHRCIARLRRLADEAPGSFSIVTQARVGYRLVSADPAGPAEPAPGAPGDLGATAPGGARVGSMRGRGVIVGVAAILMIGLIVAGVAITRPTQAVYRIAVRNFNVEGPGAGIGLSLADRVAAAVSERQLPIVSRARSSHGDFDGAHYIVGGDIQRIGDKTKVDIQLDDASSGLTLWTDTITRSSSDSDALQDQVAGKVADLMDLTRRWLGPYSDSAKPEAVAALLKATDSMRGSTGAMLQTREAFRRFRDLDPNSSRAHSGFAMATALSSLNQTPDTAAQWRTQAAAEARRAIDLDPKNGEGYSALGLLTPPKDLPAREAWFLKGLAADPNDASLPNFLGGFLLGVGRVNEAVIWIDRSVNLDPLSSPKARDMIDALATASRFSESDRLIARADRLWPDDVQMRRTILFKSLLYAPPAQALEALERFQRADKPLSADRAQVWLAFAKTRAGALRAAVADKELAAIGSNADATLSSLGNDERSALIAALASLGDKDDAFRITALSRAMHLSLEPSVLFEPATRSLRSDSRFLRLVDDLGLVRYWTQARRKPDFCIETPTPSVCS